MFSIRKKYKDTGYAPAVNIANIVSQQAEIRQVFHQTSHKKMEC